MGNGKKRQLNTSIREDLWLRIHMDIPKGQVTDIQERLWEGYFMENDGRTTNAERVRMEINEIQKELSDRQQALSNKRLLLQKLESEEKLKVEAQEKALLEARKAATSCFNCAGVLSNERTALRSGPHFGKFVCGSNTTGCCALFMADPSKREWILPKRGAGLR